MRLPDSIRSSYCYSLDNLPDRYDPRVKATLELAACRLLGRTDRIDIQLGEVEVGEQTYCKVSAGYAGQTEAQILYFDTKTYEQPKAPVGFTCGSPVEYLKAITSARY